MTSPDNRNRTKPTPLFLVLIVLAAFSLVGFVCLGIIAGSWYLFSINSTEVTTEESAPAPTNDALYRSTETSPSPQETTQSSEVIPSPSPSPISPEIHAEPMAPEAAKSLTPEETLQRIQDTQVPPSDLIDLIGRLHGITDISHILEPVPAPSQVGDQQNFWVMNGDSNTNFQVQATLQYVTDHLYFWVEDSVSFNARALKKLADTFEYKIYPTNRSFFGSEWTPGIDSDPRLHILYTSGLGSGIAGYFSSADEYPPQANEYSNAKEMFLINADTTNLSRDFTYSVLAHEFQHMIHWYRDANEDSWLNEGFSELAAFLNGYDGGGFDYVYVMDPDIQLTDWPAESDAEHYGASFLFLTYFLDRFGEQTTQALVSEQANGMMSIDQLMAELEMKDPLSGKPILADDIFADWAVAMHVRDRRVGDGRFTYHNYPEAPQPGATEVIRHCPTGIQDAPMETRQVHQYGIDYIRIRCPGNYTLHFEGASQVNLLPTQANSGSSFFWSNQGDESDMMLTRAFDFTNYSGPLSMSYWTWYDIEENYDYVYVLASTDDGVTWQILNTPSGTAEDPTGNSFGWGYTGQSGNSGQSPQWIQENLDLSRFAGRQVQLRFEYITDSAANLVGFALDDISIPQIGYSTDFETDEGGWTPEGFVRVHNILPQTFRLALIRKGKLPQVEQFTLTGENTIDIPLEIGNDIKEVILVVSGTTRITREEANYRFQVTAPLPSNPN